MLEGWRDSTVDVDLRFEPDVDELLRELPALKERLGVNIELASPPDFIPELPGWRERSQMVFQEGNVYVHHFDLYSQALSKIERGFSQDLDDVGRMIEHGLVEPGCTGSRCRAYAQTARCVRSGPLLKRLAERCCACVLHALVSLERMASIMCCLWRRSASSRSWSAVSGPRRRPCLTAIEICSG